MIAFLVHLIVAIGAGYLLFRLWRASLSGDRWTDGMIAAGFLVRALAGQLLFWISYARLPVARSLQTGNGLWFFASDAQAYFSLASALARAGVWEIVTFPAGVASVAYVKTLAVAVVLFGSVTSVGLFLNLFCYLGMAAIIVRWAAGEPRARFAARIAILAMSFSPAVVLWALQPLKDTFFQFMVVAFVGTCVVWQRAWTGTMRVPAVCLAVLAMFVALLALSGTRWYYGFIVLSATCVFLLFVLVQAKHNRWVAAASSIAVAVLLSRAFVLGAGPYTPPTIANFLTPGGVIYAAPRMPAEMLARVEEARRGFDMTVGNTSIEVGDAMANLDQAGKASAPPAPAKVAEARPAAVPHPQPAKRATAPPLAAPAPKTVHIPRPMPATTPKPPPSRLARLATGVASLVVPRSLGEQLGLFHIGGGRGMFWFTELDTIVFDVMLFCALVVLATRISAGIRNPLVYFVALLTLMDAVPLAYTISNYGTLFRLREMIYLGLALTPLALMTSVRRGETSAP